MKKILTAILIAAIMLSMAACSQTAQTTQDTSEAANENANTAEQAETTDNAEKPQAEVTWLCGTTSNLLNGEHPYYQALVFFDEALREKTNNKYGLEIYTGGQLGTDSEVLDGTLLGNYQFCIMPSGLVANVDSDFAIYDLPYLFTSSEHAYAALDSEVGTDALDGLDAYGLVGLGYGDAGFSNLTSSFPIEKPEDMKGMKLRVMEIPMQIEFFNSLGANSTPMAMTEVYTALQQGTIDGQGNVNMGIVSNRIYEVNKYVSVTEHVFSPIVYLMNKDYFDSLPEEDQQAIREAAAESIAKQRPDAQRQNENALKLMEDDYGVTILQVDKTPFIEAADQMYKNHPEYQDVVDKVRAMDPAANK